MDKEYQRKWRTDHPEYRKKKGEAWRKAHPNYQKQKRQEYKERELLLNISGPLTADEEQTLRNIPQRDEYFNTLKRTGVPHMEQLTKVMEQYRIKPVKKKGWTEIQKMAFDIKISEDSI